MAGRHVASSKNERTTALLILGIGAVAAFASMLGNVWVVRAGVLVAVVMATIALYVSFHEVKRIREEHSAALRRESEIRMKLSDKHHADSVAMIDRFNARAENLNQIIVKLRSQLGAAKSELSSMRGNAAWLRAEVAERQARIDELTARIAELEAQRDEEAAEDSIVELPERQALYPQVDDVWGEEEHPTIIDLSKLHIDEVLDLDVRKRA